MDPEESAANSTIDTSTFREGDLDLFLDCLEDLCKPNLSSKKKKKRSKSSRKRLPRQISFTEDTSNDYESVNFEHRTNSLGCLLDYGLDDTSYDDHDYANVTSITNGDDSLLNDTNATWLGEQFNDIFAYFNEDVDKTMFEEESNSGKEEEEEVKAGIQNEFKPKQQSPRRLTATKRKFEVDAVKEVKQKSKEILGSIRENEEFIRKLRFYQQQQVEAQAQPKSSPTLQERIIATSVAHRKGLLNRSLNIVSDEDAMSLSSLSLDEGDSSEIVKKRSRQNQRDAMNKSNVNVKERVGFYNSSGGTSRCTSASPSLPSSEFEDDEDIEFYKENSKRQFQQRRDYFEKFFQENNRLPYEMMDAETSLPIAVTRPSSAVLVPQRLNNAIEVEKSNLAKSEAKLVAVERYAQTKHLLQRIQVLLKAVSKLNEKQLNRINLKLLKKFLVFVRDAARNCQEVCSTISKDFLTDFERNVMSTEELLFASMRAVAKVSQQPPENELQKSHDNNTTLSEHQLRVQASLQRLNIPDWFRHYNASTASKDGTSTGGYVPGSFAKKRNSDVGRWTGLNSKTTSLSSLGSHRSDRSPLMLSPSAHSHHGQTGFSRWSTSHLNSTQTSPSASCRGSFSRGGLNSSVISGQSFGNQSTTSSGIRSSFRQPYLGWRSQEKLAQPRTPHERLASSLLARQQAKQAAQASQERSANESSSEIQSSIKEVTSAIVHYVNDQNRATSSNSRSRSTSPSSRKCWLESSFVGNRRLDSPQTPIIDNSFNGRGTGAESTPSRVNGVGESCLV